MTSGTPTWPFITTAAALLAAVVFSVLEWRRANRRHLPARLAATILALTALALLGLRPTWQHSPHPSSTSLHATLWTPQFSPSPSSASPTPKTTDAPTRFALPDATRLDPAAKPVPDAAFLRRHFPQISTLQILGDGLDPAELDALRGLRVEFTPPPPTPSTFGIRFFCHSCELNLGDPLTVQGRLAGLAPHTTLPLTLEAPDGTTTNTATTPADPAGEARFTLHAASPSAAGRFLWHLRMPAAAGHAATDLPLGIAVVAPILPRLLLLESSPRFDTAALHRWYETARGTLLTRTQIGQDRYRYASAAASPPSPFTALDAPLLAGVDLLLADARSLLALPPPERDALLAAVADTGLGVLVLPDDTLPPTAAAANPLFPWKLSPLATDTPGDDRPARLQWPGQPISTDLPVPAAPFEILSGDTSQRPLLGDRQGHTLAAVTPHGSGQLALTLVRDTTRWQRENDPAAFAAYWSFLFSRLARLADTAAGRWTLTDGDAGPVFADHPLDLLWSGPPALTLGPATVSSPPTSDQTTLALAPDPVEPGRWHGTFWPRRPGWHRVSLASGGPTLDFYVGTADAWPALAAERCRLATARFAETSLATASAPPTLPPIRAEIPPFWFATLFFLSAGYLWIERRFTH